MFATFLLFAPLPLACLRFAYTMDFRRDLLTLLHTFNNDTWCSSRLGCFRWVLTYFQLRLNFPFLNWLILRLSDRSMAFRFSDCEISPVYEEFCASAACAFSVFLFCSVGVYHCVESVQDSLFCAFNKSLSGSRFYFCKI